MYMHVIKHYNTKNEVVAENTNKPAMVVFPSSSFLTAMKTNIESKIQATSSASFISKIYNNDLKDRVGFVNISFALGNRGYDVAFTHDFSHAMNEVIDPALELPTEYNDLFPDFIASFLGKSYGDGQPFSDSFFLMVKSELLAIIERKSNAQAQPAPVENNNEPIQGLGTENPATPSAEVNPPATGTVVNPAHIDPLAPATTGDAPNY